MASFYAGNGVDGALSITSSRTEDTTRGVSNINSAAASGQKNVALASGASFSAGDWVLLIQMTGTGVGNYEFAKIASKNTNTLTMEANLSLSYAATGAQCIRMGQYSSVTVGSGGTWTASAWNGTTGGVLAAMISGNLVIDSGRSIDVKGKGFGGGGGASFAIASSGSGPGAGGGADGRFSGSSQGGGGGHGASGSQGGNVACGGCGGSGGGTYGAAALGTAQLGSGGGGGSRAGAGGNGGDGGAGGGILILVVGGNITVTGSITANGNDGSTGAFSEGNGGGGSGGSIRLICTGTISFGSSVVTANGGGNGGSGGAGRIATLSGSSRSGTTSPSVDASSGDTVTTADPYAPLVAHRRSIIVT